jgi:hypothetical protein
MAKIQKNQLQVSVSNGFVDEGDGLITFPAGLTITDGSTMRSGTRYDIPSLEISNYPGQLTADHTDSLGTLIGKVQGVQKQGDRVFVNGIKYAVKESAYARLAYDLLVGGFSNSFSIETMGPWPDETDNTYYRHELVGLSQVVVPNNYNAKTNQFNEIVHNSLERSQQDGLDVSGIENTIVSQVKLVKSEAVEEESMTKDKKNNNLEEKETPVETPEVKPEVEKTEVVETETPEKVEPETETPAEEAAPAEPKAPGKGAEPEVEVKQEGNVTDKSGETPQNPEAPAPKEEVREETPAEAAVPEVKEELKEEVEAPAETPETETPKNQTNKNIEENLEMTKEEIAEIVAQSVAAALKPVQDELKEAKETAQNAFDAAAKEPEFTKPEEETPVANSYDSMSSEEIFSKQLNAAVAVERMQSVEARKTLSEINARNLQALKDEKIVNAAMTLEDLGNFVIAPELYNQIVGVRTNYQTLIDATQWRETNSLEFAWLSRTSDIDMQPVAIGALGDVDSPDVSNDRLKPVSVPTYRPNTDKLEELAAVTPISINVIKFAAADILADVAEGYRNDYDRKRAQLIVARLQQAVNASGQKYAFDISDGLIGWARVASNISDATSIGTLVMNNKSLTALKGQALDNYNGSILAEITNGSILGIPFIIVPNDLLPTLNTTETKVFNVQGVNVTVDQAVFYGDLRTFTGRSSGGLKYDVDGSASYSLDGGATYRSAYQFNEVVLRGSFFRGGVVKDPAVIASIPASAVS